MASGDEDDDQHGDPDQHRHEDDQRPQRGRVRREGPRDEERERYTDGEKEAEHDPREQQHLSEHAPEIGDPGPPGGREAPGLTALYGRHALGEPSLRDDVEREEDEQDQEHHHDQGDDEKNVVEGPPLSGERSDGGDLGGVLLVEVSTATAATAAPAAAPRAQAREEPEEPEVSVVPGDPDSVPYEVSVVHRISTQVSFILPPLEMLTTCLPGAATRLREPGTVSTSPGSSGSGARTSIR